MLTNLRSPSSVRLLAHPLFAVALAAAFFLSASFTFAQDDEAAIDERLREQFGDAYAEWPEELKEAFRQTERNRPPSRALTPEEIEEQRQLAEQRAEEAARRKVEEWPARLAELQKTLRPTFSPGERQPESSRHDNAAHRQKLETRIAEAQARRPAVERELNEIATRYEIGRTGRHPDGRGWTLVGESAGQPILMTTQNARAAASIFASDLWPIGLYTWQNPLLTRNLTGAGVTTAIWEADPRPGILTTHLEFSGGRAIQVDGATPGNHATAVANAIAGGGNLDVIVNGSNLGRWLRGVAYESQVRGHGLIGFQSNSVASVLGGQRFSNHSYGVSGGWDIINVGGQLYWFWPFPQFSRDPTFGLYSSPTAGGISSADLDAFVFTSELQLPVYAAGNPRMFGPGQPVTHVIQVGVDLFLTNAERAWFNGGLAGESWTPQSKGFNTVLSPSSAKNVLSVGSIQDVVGSTAILSEFSGTGPTDDGRIKPDVVAVGERNADLGVGNSLFLARAGSNSDYYDSTASLRGTSFAAPQVTGALALGQERHAQLYPNAGPWLASTWRALTIHTAQDVDSPGPTYEKGWGVFDAIALVKQMETDADLGRGTLVKEFEIADGQPKSFLATLPADTAGRLTLTWTDLPGDPAPTFSVVDDDTAMLVNDIDLLVEDIDTGDKYYPWILDPDLENMSPQVRGAPAVNTVIGGVVPRDGLNNVERIDIAPAAQERRIRVTISPYSTIENGPQKVSLVLGGAVPNGPTTKEFAPTGNPTDETETAFTFTSDPGGYYTLETRPLLEAGSWSPVSTVLAVDDVTTVLLSRSPTDDRRFWRIRRGD